MSDRIVKKLEDCSHAGDKHLNGKSFYEFFNNKTYFTSTFYFTDLEESGFMDYKTCINYSGYLYTDMIKNVILRETHPVFVKALIELSKKYIKTIEDYI